MSYAKVTNHRQSPRKVRLVADLVRGRDLNEALVVLNVLPKRASEIVSKVVRSAAANAEHNENLKSTDLYIKEIRVDEGFTLKRSRPRARGRAFPIRKRTSHIQVTLGSRAGIQKAIKSEKAEVVAEEKDIKKKPVKA
jgi:large subunit ribosomal protein L22